MIAASDGFWRRRRVPRLAGATAAVLAAWLAAGCSAPPAVTGCEPGDGPVPVCGFTNPEDLAPFRDGWIVVSQYPEAAGVPGSLIAWRPDDDARRTLFPTEDAARGWREGAGDDACREPPDAGLFAPHGIDVDAGHAQTTLWVVNHGGREAVERFRLEQDATGAPRLMWEGCVPLPGEAQGNDVVALPDGGFAVTWFMDRASGAGLALAFARVALGLDTGRVLVWRAGEGFEEVPGSESSAPNGIEVSPDGRTLFVGAWGGQRLLRLPRDGDGEPADVALPHHPDNLTWAPDGRLLVAGQRGPVTHVAGCAQVEEGTCGMSWSVVAVDPESLATEILLEEDPARTTGAASVSLAVGDRLLVGTFAGDRIVWVPR